MSSVPEVVVALLQLLFGGYLPDVEVIGRTGPMTYQTHVFRPHPPYLPEYVTEKQISQGMLDRMVTCLTENVPEDVRGDTAWTFLSLSLLGINMRVYLLSSKVHGIQVIALRKTCYYQVANDWYPAN